MFICYRYMVSFLFDRYSGKYVVSLCVLFKIVAKYISPPAPGSQLSILSTGRWKYKIQISAQGLRLLCRAQLHADLEATKTRFYTCSSANASESSIWERGVRI